MSFAKYFVKGGLIVVGLLAFVPASQATQFVAASQCSSCVGEIVNKRSCGEVREHWMGRIRYHYRCANIPICTNCLN